MSRKSSSVLDENIGRFPNDGQYTADQLQDLFDSSLRHDDATLSQRGDPSTGEVPDGEAMVFVSDGSGTGAAGDLVYAVNDSGSILTTIVAARSNAT